MSGTGGGGPIIVRAHGISIEINSDDPLYETLVVKLASEGTPEDSDEPESEG
jgi:hypothetical protein